MAVNPSQKKARRRVSAKVMFRKGHGRPKGCRWRRALFVAFDMNRMKKQDTKKMKPVDWLLERFIWIYTLFLYSLALPFALFLMVALGEIAEELMALARYPILFIGSSVAFGLFLKNGGRQKVKKWWARKKEEQGEEKKGNTGVD